MEEVFFGEVAPPWPDPTPRMRGRMSPLRLGALAKPCFRVLSLAQAVEEYKAACDVYRAPEDAVLTQGALEAAMRARVTRVEADYVGCFGRPKPDKVEAHQLVQKSTHFLSLYQGAEELLQPVLRKRAKEALAFK